MSFKKVLYAISNKTGVTRGETVIISVLLSMFLLGLIFASTFEYTSKEDILKAKDWESLGGNSADSLFAEETFSEWNKESGDANKIVSSPETPFHKKVVKVSFRKKDINTATREELIEVNGIGEWTANQIFRLKEKNNGRVDSLSQLSKIRGMRPEILDAIKKHFEVRK